MICCGETYSKGPAIPLKVTVTPAREVANEPGAGATQPLTKCAPKMDSNSPGAIEVTGCESAASRMQVMGVGGAAGSKLMRSAPVHASSMPVAGSYASTLPGTMRAAVITDPSMLRRVS